MVKQSTHKRWKGCCMLCGRFRCNGKDNVPHRVKRMLGQSRRISRRRVDVDS